MSTTDFEIAFLIPELTDAFDPRVTQVEEAMDIVVSSHSGVSVATVIATGSDAVAAGRAASATLSACGLPPKRTYPDLVSRQDIADRLDVSRQAVGNWVRGERHQEYPFPAPANLVAGGVWLWATSPSGFVAQGVILTMSGTRRCRTTPVWMNSWQQHQRLSQRRERVASDSFEASAASRPVSASAR